MPAPRYTTQFTFTATAATQPSEADKMEAKASLVRLKPLLPANIDPETDETIVWAVGNLAVAAVVNLNDDAVTLADTVRVYRGFEHQQVNLEHQRSDVVGFILKAGLSEVGTDRLLTDEEALAADKPVNIAIVIAFWRVVAPDLCDWVLKASAPGSPDQGKLSLSFEVGFDDYGIVLLPKGTSDLALASGGIVASNSPAFDKLDRALRVNGGSGSYGKDGQRVARVLSGNIIPLGAGVVTVPAAAVKGIAAVTESPHQAETEAGLYKYSSTQVTLSEADAAPFRSYAQSIPDEHIYTDPADPTLGREMESHVTALYGITAVHADAIKPALTDVGPIRIKLGAVSSFEGGDRPYDVLKVDIESADLQRVHAAIKGATETVSKWPDYHPHLTLAYLRKGAAAQYVGDTRFAGTELTFRSLTFSPSEGSRTEIPLPPVYNDDTMAASVQISAEFVGLKESVERQLRAGIEAASASRYIKLSEGWQARLGEIIAAEKQAQANDPKLGGVPLVNGVNITLSDGRKMANVKVFDGATLELDKELSMSGVVITDMTPGEGPQNDDQDVLHPEKADIVPTTTPEQQARDAADQAKNHEGAMRAYTDAAIAHITRVEASVSPVTDAIASQPATPSPMNLADLKQTIAKIKTIEDLPAVMANTALFAEEISRASEEQSALRKTAEEAAATAVKKTEEVAAQLATLQQEHATMKAEQAAAAAAVKYQERMATIDEVFALDDEVKAEIIPEVKACADDASFDKWLSKAKKMMKEKTKDFQKKKKAADNDADDEASAAKAAQEALAAARNNPVDAPIAGGTPVGGTKSLKDQYAEAFAGGILVAGTKIADLNKLPIKGERS